MIKRIFDFSSSLLGLVILFPLLILISFAIKIGSSGPILFSQKRVGKDGKQFILIKFRSMLINQQSNNTATAKGDDRITTIGVFLRKYKLDELPELWNVLKGEMSLVGPRPALFNQEDLINLRTEKDIHKLKPGITGWAQVNGRDEITIPKKVSLEEEYLDKMSWKMDMYILWLTFVKVLKKDSINH